MWSGDREEFDCFLDFLACDFSSCSSAVNVKIGLSFVVMQDAMWKI